MYGGLAIAIGFGTALLGGWCLVEAARDRWLDRSHLVVLGIGEAALLIQSILAAFRLAGGDRPGEFVTFLGYLAVSVVILPAAVALAAMERTRWGAAIAGVGAITAAVVTLRLTQVWAT